MGCVVARGAPSPQPKLAVSSGRWRGLITVHSMVVRVGTAGRPQAASPMMRRRRFLHAQWLGAALALATFAPAPSAWAQDSLQRASEAYERGRRAAGEHDYLVAARSFAEADTLVPDATALESALQAVVLADDPVLGMNLVERAQRSPATAAMSVVSEARDAFRSRAGKVTAECGATPCTLEVDGVSVATLSTWLSLGEHAATLRGGDRVLEQRLAIIAGASFVLRLPEPSVVPLAPAAPLRAEPETAPQAAPDAGPHGSSVLPIAFWTGVGVTAALGIGAVASNAVVAASHDEFVSKCQSGSPASLDGCLELQNDGEAATTRTQILYGATATLAAATTVIGFVWLSSSHEPSTAVATSVSVGVDRVVLRRSF